MYQWSHSFLRLPGKLDDVQRDMQRAGRPYLPTRLLEIDRTNEDDIRFRLVTGRDCSPGSPYVTLSYCWGTKPPSQIYRLLKSTEANMRTKRPVSTLPKTFRHAMEIAGRLGVQHIWIDRLCIFQDSREDFQKEASSMADVYKNALLNIAALSAEDDEGGCFFQRDPSRVAPLMVHLRLGSNDIPTAYVPQGEHDAWTLNFADQPLLSRGWVLQERLLAPRVLYFGREQVFWECKFAACCKTRPQDIFASYWKWNSWDKTNKSEALENPYRWKRLIGVGLKTRAPERYSQLLNDWTSIVELYSTFALTISSDKLVALSGLVDDMRRRLEKVTPGTHRFIAGHWEEMLPACLAFHVVGPTSRANEYRAPTWSWACLDGKVKWPSITNQKILTSVVSINEESTASVTKSGGVKHVRLTLKGPLARARVGPPEGYNRLGDNLGGRWSRVTSIGTSDMPSPSDNSITSHGLYVDFDTLDDIQQNSEVLLIFIVYDQFQTPVGIGEIIRAYGLAVVPSVSEAGTYQRVGYCSIELRDYSAWIEILSSFQKQSITLI